MKPPAPAKPKPGKRRNQPDTRSRKRREILTLRNLSDIIEPEDF